jgi:GT2 family glycosyltransferase
LKRQEHSLVYIILINYNGLQDTIECLESILKIKYKRYKIILVDNASGENEASILSNKFPEIKILTNKINLGFTGGNNLGIKEALKDEECKYILIINNDTIVPRDFLDKLIIYADLNPDTLISPKILFNKTDRIQCMGCKILKPFGISLNYLKNKKSYKINRIITPDFLSGCCILIPTKIIKQIGLFNDLYFAYWEDTEYCFRSKKAGYKLAVLPNSFIWHKHSKSSESNPGKKQYLLIRNQIIFVMKHFKFWEKIFILILFAPIFHFFLNLLRYKNLKFIRFILKGYFDGLSMSKRL